MTNDTKEFIQFVCGILLLYYVTTSFSGGYLTIDKSSLLWDRVQVRKLDINNPLKYCEYSFWGLNTSCYVTWFEKDNSGRSRWYYYNYNVKRTMVLIDGL